MKKLTQVLVGGVVGLIIASLIALLMWKAFISNAYIEQREIPKLTEAARSKLQIVSVGLVRNCEDLNSRYITKVLEDQRSQDIYVHLIPYSNLDIIKYKDITVREYWMINDRFAKDWFHFDQHGHFIEQVIFPPVQEDFPWDVEKIFQTFEPEYYNENKTNQRLEPTVKTSVDPVSEQGTDTAHP